jgi:hypothetical protein
MYFESGERGLICKPYGAKFIVVPGTSNYPTEHYFVERIAEFSNHKKATLTNTDDMVDLDVETFVPMYLRGVAGGKFERLEDFSLRVGYVNGKSFIAGFNWIGSLSAVFTLDESGELTAHKCYCPETHAMEKVNPHEVLHLVLDFRVEQSAGEDCWDFASVMQALTHAPMIYAQPKGISRRGASLLVYYEYRSQYVGIRRWVVCFDYRCSKSKPIYCIKSDPDRDGRFTDVLADAGLNLQDNWGAWCEEHRVSAIADYRTYYHPVRTDHWGTYIRTKEQAPDVVARALANDLIDFVMYEEFTPHETPIFVFRPDGLLRCDMEPHEIAEVYQYVQSFNNRNLQHLLMTEKSLNKFPWDV